MTKEFRFENHYYRWTIIDTYKNARSNKLYGLAESSIGDEAPYILFEIDEKQIPVKTFKNRQEVVDMSLVPSNLIIDDEVYDDIITALEDNDII